MTGRNRMTGLLLAGICLLGCAGYAGADTGTESTEAAAGERESREETAAGEKTAGNDVVYLSMATSGNWQNILRGSLWDEYCGKLEEWSGGSLVMRTYSNGALGNDLELIEGVSEGTLCIINSVPSYQISKVPEAALLDVPGMFSEAEEYNFFMDSFYGETMQEYYHEQGLHLLDSSAYDFRVLTSSVPIRSMEDIRGLKLRTMENKYQVAFWQAMGAYVISMNFNQVRLAIQQGILQAQENPLGYMVSAGLSDVQNQGVRTNHVLMVSNFVMNEEQYEALSEEHKLLLERFFQEMSRELAEKQPRENAEMAEQLAEAGIAVCDAPEDIRKAVTGTGQPAVLELLRQDLGEDTVDDYLEKVEEAKAAYDNYSQPGENREAG